MGAFDTYSAKARCTVCGDWFWLDGQTKFFAPRFGAYHFRSFDEGRPQPLDFAPEKLVRARVWDAGWIRVREPQANAETLHVLVDFDDLTRCTCGTPHAEVLCFRLRAEGPESGTATLVHVGLYDALNDPCALDVDFADAERLVPWRGNWKGWDGESRAVASLPPDARAARLRDLLAAHFQGPSDAPSTESPRWTAAIAPVRCESCGDIRERTIPTDFSGDDRVTPFLGAGWTGGMLRPGTRVEGDFGWLDGDGGRGRYARLRHPAPADGFAVASEPFRFGCRCGAGPVSAVLRFARDAGGVTLTDATLRVVKGRADLADVDFVLER